MNVKRNGRYMACAGTYNEQIFDSTTGEVRWTKPLLSGLCVKGIVAVFGKTWVKVKPEIEEGKNANH